MTENRYELNKNLAQMGGVIMDTFKILQNRLMCRGCWCGSCYGLGRIPADVFRAAGGASMSDPKDD